jgi:hypothetical protein
MKKSKFLFTVVAFATIAFQLIISNSYAQTIATAAVTTTNCAGSSINVPYTVTGVYNVGNIFTAELSDVSGSFASPVAIGSLSAIIDGTISAVIPSNTPAGTGYRIRVTSDNPVILGTDNGSNITINALPVETISASSIIVCAGTPDTLKAITTGGLAPFTYTWTPAGVQSFTHDTTVITPSTAGTKKWKLTLTDANTCSVKDSIIVTVNALPTETISASATTLCAGTPDTLKAITTGGLAPFTYTWTPAGTQSFTHDTTIITPSTPGTKKWKLTLTDANTCSIKDSITVTVNGFTSEHITASATSLCLATPDTLIAVTTGGLAPFTYTWTPAGIQSFTHDTTVITPLTAGFKKWKLLVSDANSCSLKDSITVAVKELPSETISASATTLCAGTPDTLSAVTTGGLAPFTYAWTPAGTQSFTHDTTVITPSSAGTKKWRLTLTDANSCSTKDSIVVTVNALPTETISASALTLCAGTPDTLMAVTSSGLAPFTYTWTPAGVQSFTHDTTVITPSTAGVKKWKLTLTDSNSCSVKDSITVTVNGFSSEHINASSTVLCVGLPDTLIAVTTGGLLPFTYTWTPAGIQSFTHDTTVLTPATTGIKKWKLTLTDGNSCSLKDSITVTVNALPTETISASATTLCAGTPDTLKALTTGGLAPFSYTWTPAGTQSFTHDTTVITPSTAGVKKWRLTLTDANSCSTKDSITVTVNALPTETISASATALCVGMPDTLTAVTTGGLAPFTYTWTPAGTQSFTHDTTIITPFTIGIKKWKLTLTDANSCSVKDSITVTVNGFSSEHITASSTSLCVGLPDTLRAIAAGGLAPFTYTWTPSGTQSFTHDTTIITPSTVGIKKWKLTLTDAHSCSVKDSITVTVNALPVETISASALTLCAGTPDTLKALTTGGLAPFTYTWTPAGIQSFTHDTTVITPSTAGIKKWKLTLKDANACTVKDSITVTVNALPTVTASASAATICIGSSVTLNGSGAVSYTWTGGVVDGVAFVPQSTNTYIVTGTDANGCKDTAMTTVMAHGVDTSVIVNGATFTSNAILGTCQWLNCSTNILISGALGHDYTATANGSYALVISQNGCSDTSSCYSYLSTGLENTAFDTKVLIYPNPFSSQTTIEIKGFSAGNYQLRIVDLLGREVFKSLTTSSQLQFNREDLQAGIYFIEIGSPSTQVGDSGKVIAKEKIVIQ